MDGNNVINPGDYIVVQRQGYTKLHKIKDKGTLTLGSFLLELDNALGERYHTTFQMKLKPGTKRLYTLEKANQTTTVAQLSIESSGADNRNITDDGSSQALTKDEIGKLKEDESLGSCDIVEQLISNSRTFTSKTEYSQEKYMKKKEKKYFEYVQIRKPTLRLLAQMFYRQDPAKTLGVRIDDLAQILSYANVQGDGNFLLYDSGSSGLVTAAVLNAIGAGTTGKLIHAHPGNECQKNAVLAMRFPPEQLDRCINVNLYSVLRCYYQSKSGRQLKLSDDDDDGCGPPPAKKPCWQEDNERACDVLRGKVDGLIVVCKEHPVAIVKELVEFLDSSRSLVVFNLLKEPLQDLYLYLKGRTDFVSLRLSSNFMRHYQVLPDRTHPEVNMSNGGYLMVGFKLNG